ncbi:MAG: hypothetical protein SWH68_06645 [Thermodesulfobacteriota bacterium]|nr:hypothetical protein [Thermodesulfobacteriota bacterium]
MEALRFTAKPTNRRVTIELPANMGDDIVEVIVLSTKKTSPAGGSRRKPPAELKNTVIHDDLIAPAIPPDEWDALQ